MKRFEFKVILHIIVIFLLSISSCLPSRLRNGLINVTTNSNPFTFYFADKASQEITSLIIWAYSSDEYSTSGLMGYWSWYNSILMVKENESN